MPFHVPVTAKQYYAPCHKKVVCSIPFCTMQCGLPSKEKTTLVGRLQKALPQTSPAGLLLNFVLPVAATLVMPTVVIVMITVTITVMLLVNNNHSEVFIITNRNVIVMTQQ